MPLSRGSRSEKDPVGYKKSTFGKEAFELVGTRSGRDSRRLGIDIADGSVTPVEE